MVEVLFVILSEERLVKIYFDGLANIVIKLLGNFDELDYILVTAEEPFFVMIFSLDDFFT